MTTAQRKKEAHHNLRARDAASGSGDPILRPPEASAYLGISESTLAKRRVYGLLPKFCKLGARLVGYRVSACNEFLAACERTSTSGPGR